MHRRIALFSVKVAVTAGLFFLPWRAADGPRALQSLALADWQWIVIAVVILHVHTGLAAFRWQFTARQLGLSFGPWRALGEYHLAQFVNQSLPGGLLGDVGRAVRGRRHAGLTLSGHAVVLERLAGQIAMAATLAVGVAVTLVGSGELNWPGIVVPFASVLAICAAGIAGLIVLLRFRAEVRPSATSFYLSFHAAFSGRWILLSQIGFSLRTTVAILLAFVVCAHSVGLDLPISASLTLVPLVLLAMLIPVSVAGWGLREGAAVAFLPIAGAAPAEALAASIVFGLTGLVAALPGGLVLLLNPTPSQQDRKEG
ncbi:lysylphosphatidylglycerol synthase transmembrane domain-containing protein [Roseibium sp.]|uniref:lysylphosphatidylglycerol synthase transmembrane domain-containing protein n=1 Tax=Roseibium sp. TaxID=1936156 RepID=UPI003B50BD46